MLKFRTLLGVATALALFAGPAAAQTELKFGHVGGPSSLFHVSAEHFAKIANERLGGKYKVVVYHSSQLGNDTELLDAWPGMLSDNTRDYSV
jgi:TRAP-type transport system periplasmic protein